jgi:hypothetical protein
MTTPALLPPPPYRLRSSFVMRQTVGVVLLAACAVGAGGGYAWWQVSEAASIVHDSSLWASSGVSEVEVSVHGKLTSNKFIFNSYDLDVSFRDEEGRSHHGKSKFETLFARVNEDSPALVRYRPGNPDDFALSWAVDKVPSRWAGVAFMGGVGVLLIGGSFGGLAYQRYRVLQKASRAVREGAEAECKVLRVEDQMANGRPTGYRLFHFLIPDRLTRGVRVEGKEAFHPKKGMAFLFEGGQRLLALVPPEAPDKALALREDLYPLDFDARTVQAIQEAAGKRTAEAPVSAPVAEAS